MRLTIVGLLASVALVAGGSGSLDRSFGSGGEVVTAIGDGGGARAIALQPDGMLVVAGFGGYYGAGDNFEIARYTRRGGLDVHFGQDGEVTTDFGTDLDQAFAVKVQRDGKIVAAGYAYAAESPAARVAVARYRPNGSLDPSFGTNGKVLEPGFGFALALQRDGKLIVGGQDANGRAFALYRLKPDGSLDAGFGTNGEVTTSFGVSAAEVHGLAIQSDGKIVAVGQAVQGYQVDGALARYDPDGSLDTTFGSGGKVTGLPNTLEAVVLQGSRRILAAAGDALVGLRRNGSLDRSFGHAGEVTMAPFKISATALALQPDGKIVVAGTGEGQNDDFALARFRPKWHP